MTRRNATQDLSRSLSKPTTSRPRLRRRRRSPRLWKLPFQKAYARLQGDEDHPVDMIVGAVPEITRVDRRARLLARHFEKHVGAPEQYRSYEDLRLLQRCLREEAFYDVGHAHGVVVGRLESREVLRSTPQSRKLERAILGALHASTLPPKAVAALLIELVRAVTLGLPSPAHRRSRQNRV